VKITVRQKPSVLKSQDFFFDLRAALGQLGLRGEERFGIGAYLVAASRMSANPLRLWLQEQTGGNANYLLTTVQKLVAPGTFVEIRTGAQSAGALSQETLANKVAVLAEGDGPTREELVERFEVSSNALRRIAPNKERGRVVENNREVRAPFACVSSDHRYGFDHNPRWLTMKLERPAPRVNTKKNSAFNFVTPPSARELAEWRVVQTLIDQCVQEGVQLPTWVDVVVEEGCKDERNARHLPTFLQAWKTVAAMRSLTSLDAAGRSESRRVATFEDFAATALLLRKVFRAGNECPSVQKVFDKLGTPGDSAGVICPVTGNGRTYRIALQQTKWKSVLEDDEFDS
jgi:hypothetical protein